MFNVLVSGLDTAWESEQRMGMDRDRFREHSGDESAAIDPRDPDSLKALEGMETLLMYELSVSAPHAAEVRLGQLHDIRVDPTWISFRFTESGRIARSRVHELAHRLQIERWETNRTHWAVKDGRIPLDVHQEATPSPPNYDVVLSFAGEDRCFVEQVANLLLAHDVLVFYDTFEEATLWGKDLVEWFDGVYRLHGRFCVMFISQHYATKMWTRHERRSALARALDQRLEYILPARFDDAEIVGLSPSIGYVDLRITTPEKLARLVLQKLGRA